jgi:D-alanyl-D-alanine dipeptidase
MQRSRDDRGLSMTRRTWEDFVGVLSQTFVHGLVADAQHVATDELVDMSCHHRTSIIICLAYAQDELIYNAKNQIIAVDRETYSSTPREQRVNKFGLAYKHDAKFLLHKTLANIVVGAADYLYKTQGWRTVLYDGLRTVDGAFNLYNFATDDDLSSNILAMPGQSAHNKGLAIDSMMVDENGCEIEMGGHFDHLDMSTNMRHYNGDKISSTAKKNRIIREAAFLRSAFSQGLLIAPLRNEFWDDRLPENREDLWRVLDSAARCVDLEYHIENKESWNYVDFLENWQKIFARHEDKLREIIGCTTPPLTEKPEFYHGNYHPIYDMELI